MFAAAAVGQVQSAALAKGLGDFDQSVMIRVLEELAGVVSRRAV
jgi:hypothetical protein